MLVGVGTDEESPVVDALTACLERRGDVIVRLARGGVWPEVGRTVGEAVRSGKVERAVVCCHTGTGVSIAANKVPGVRAALCTDTATAIGARRWNDANVLALGLSVVSSETAQAILEAFLSTAADASTSEEIADLDADFSS